MRLKTSLLFTSILSIFCSVADAQQSRDPFAKPAWARAKTETTAPRGKTSSGISPLAIPSIEARINYYKRLREAAILNNTPVPKVTTVLALDELAVTGIFKTPRGYGAIVEAKPLKLSYTIYPGDKFFDGQLVAVEENRLIFRKVTKLSNGKFSISEEIKPLRQYTVQQELSGTAPPEAITKREITEREIPVNQQEEKKTASEQDSVVPLFEEMLRQQGLSPEKTQEKQKKSSSEDSEKKLKKQEKNMENKPTKSKKKS